MSLTGLELTNKTRWTGTQISTPKILYVSAGDQMHACMFLQQTSS